MKHFPELERLGVLAAITDRADGDCRAPSRDARLACFGAAGVDAAHVVCAEQVHGERVARAGATDGGRGALEHATAIPNVDGLITDTPGLALGISVADCVPLYLVDPVRRAVGLLHAGRAGTIANIARAGVAAMAAAFGTRPADLYAVVGPSAGPERYEVSEELAAAWRARGLPASGRLLDLWAANAQQLESVGVPAAQTHIVGICTITDPRFHSHRRDANGARNLALLALPKG